MTTTEWDGIANRMSGLWQPRMDSDAKGAYYDRLSEFTAAQVRGAIDALADTTKTRPTVAAIREVIKGPASQSNGHEDGALPPRDVLDAASHRYVMAELSRQWTPEHRRRHEAVMALLRETGHRVPIDELPRLMAESRCTPEEFDKRLAAHRAKARPRRHALMSTDPEEQA